MASLFMLNEDADEESQPITIKKHFRIFRDRTSFLDSLDDAELYIRYRLPRSSIFKILDEIRAELTRDTNRQEPLSPEIQTLVTLRYLAKGGFQSEVADLHGISQPSVSRSITKTVEAIIKCLNLISFQMDPLSLKKRKLAFYKLARFPNVIGCIDGTQIPIIRPTEDEVAFVCRKGYHSLNIQAVCDAELRFINVVCKWPGATHDSFILSQSAVTQALENSPGTGWLLGDAGYACKSWLLTPVSHPTQPCHHRYNKTHMSTRNTIERAFGLLKSRFRCLSKTTGVLPFQPGKSQKVVYAACQLHNFCLDEKLPPPPPIHEEDNALINVDIGEVTGEGAEMRNNLIRQFFN